MGKPKKKDIVSETIKATGQVKTPALLLDVSGKTGTAVHIRGVMVTAKNGNRDLKIFPLTNSQSLAPFKKLPYLVLRALEDITNEKLNDKRKAAEINYASGKSKGLQRDAFIQNELRLHLHGAFQHLKPFTSLFRWFYQAVDDMLITTTVIKAAAISNYIPTLSFEFIKPGRGRIRLLAMISINDKIFHASEFKQHGFLLQSRSEFFLLKLQDADTLENFPNGFLDTDEKNLAEFIKKTVLPLTENYTVNRDAIVQREIIETAPQCKVHLNELNNSFLMIRINWQYGETELDNNNEAVTIIETVDKTLEIKRDAVYEKETTAFIRSQHKKFEQQRNDYFYLSFEEAEKSQWFVKFYRKLVDNNIPLYGMEQLKHFRYNINTPVLKIEHNGNGIDWFDLRIEISYGDLQVTLNDLQKALFNRQSFILLKDGTIGAIPEEWANEYALLLRLGKVDKDSLRLSKLHWTMLQDIDKDGVIARQIISKEYKEKWQRLENRDTDIFKVPAAITAQLRDYQTAGFQWMCLLDEMQWGGCLADDMGLGKTLQSITFLQHLSEKYKNEIHLVICPTSLLYNWENELKKFAPHLTYFIHHGAARNVDHNVWKNYDIIITSYGTVRSDIDDLAQIKFGYIILDESHSIKNPASQVSKVVLLLQSRNRLILSGTPIQNNTFDLYAQMQFINPGLLGNREFFKTEFANPIDKSGNKEKSAQLRKMIFPFLMRRTKEQVAKDLPSKTEITIWCEMGEEQRRVYDAIKTYYRENLLNRVHEEGIGKNAIYILEGLTRLRQVCNAPQLLNNPDFPTKESVKLEELLNEIEENTGEHKVLVFSQFTGMLKLISETMNERSIPHLYLDGSTKATDRMQLVERFQTQQQEQVFLISLKAGGVGLNLTAADYVYLADPWWNPAAEQQAIDRTHRIGQQNKVFAYKMICRDTVEEKILALQQRKKSLADDLISEDAGFVKKLTADDVAYLFS